MNGQFEKKITIDDVARICGVSKTTVSRYLNGRYDGFSAATKAKISSVIEELNYKPDRSAQRLKASRTNLIGCVLGDISSPFSALLLKGIMEVCDKAGYQVLFSDCDNNPQKEASIIEGLLANRVDGLIVNTSGENEKLLNDIHSRNLAIVLADRRLIGESRLDTVELDNEEMAFQCVKLLHDYGYQQVAFFSQGNKSISPRVLRYWGYLRGMNTFFPESQKEFYEFDIGDDEGCQRLLDEYKAKYPNQRIAIITVNGVTTQWLLQAFMSTEYSWGYDFGLCSFDDWIWLKLAQPGITSVLQPSREIGARAAELLIEQIEGRRKSSDEPVLIQYPGKITVRASTVKESAN